MYISNGRIAFDFLARVLRSGSKGLHSLKGVGKHEDVAEEAYLLAISMVGNHGQASVIEMTGIPAFHEAAIEAYEGGDAADSLMSACPYPEAVGEILEEAGQLINDLISDKLEQEAEENEEDEESWWDW